MRPNGVTGRRSLANRGLSTAVALVAVVGLSAPASASSPTADRVAVARHNPHGKFLGVVKNHSKTGSAAPAAPASALTYHGGPVQHSSAVYAIFWVPGLYFLPSGYQSTIAQYFTDVAHDSFKTSNVYSSDTQYYDMTGTVRRFASYSVTFRKAIPDGDPLPANGCPNYKLNDGSTSKNCLTDAQIANEIKSVIAAGHLPTGLGTEYFLFTPPGLASCISATALGQGGCYDPLAFSGYCAYHSSIGSGSTAVLYANQPYADLSGCSSGQSPNGNPADSTLNVVSHEHNETMTDPLGTAWWDSSGNENGDKCNFSFGAALGSTSHGQFNQLINGHGYWLQREWSNRTGACVQRNTFPQPTASFTFAPASPVHGAKVTFTSTSHDSDDATLTYRWVFPNGSVSTLANPTYIFGTAGTKTVTLTVFDPHGDQARIARTITVT
jgi:hypothetical protein